MIKSTPGGFVWFSTSLLLFLIFSSIFSVEPLFNIINILLGAYCIFLIFFASRSPYSLIQVFALASFVLLAITPRLEMSLGITYWGASPSVFHYYPLVSFLSLIAILAFSIGWRLQRHTINHSEDKASRAISGTSAVIVSGLAVFLIFFYNDFSFVNVIFRSGSGSGDGDGGRIAISQTLWLIYAYFIYEIPSIALVLYLLGERRKKIFVLLLFILALLGNPPTGMARWQAAMLYLAILISFAPRLANQPYLLVWSLFIGLFAVFPLLDLFRFFTSEIDLVFGFDWILNGHFDSMQNFSRAVEYEFVTWGWQLLGVVGFFIPRAIWPNKPIGSGQELAGIANLNFNNIGMNFLGEGYVNFGIIGTIFFAFALGLIFGRLDARFWHGHYRGRASEGIYLFLIGGSFFLVRGDLMSSFAYLTGTITSVITVRFIILQRHSWQVTLRRKN